MSPHADAQQVGHAGSASLTVIDRSGPTLGTRLREYRAYRTLFLFLVLRDIRLRFRQTFLGVAWAVLQPLLPMLIFAAVFGRAGAEAHGIPYRLFVFSGFTLWIFVGNSVTTASPTFVNNYAMLSKIYFPRVFLPAAVSTALSVDALIAFIALAAFLWPSGYAPNIGWLFLPVVAAATLVVAITMSVAAAAFTAVFRDVKNAVPVVVQLWMFASPVLYSVDQIPEPARAFAGLNPMTGLLEAFRCCIFGLAPDWQIIGSSAAAFLVLLGITATLFHRLEADLAERV